MQNNLIPKMENLNKLKEMEYLNLAVNNVEVIEGVKGCESLKKLDLTLNFIDIEHLEESFTNLSSVPGMYIYICFLLDIRDLYTTGNPCEDFEFFRDFVVGMVPQLLRLNGKTISPSERIKATQNLEFMTKELRIQAEKNIQKKIGMLIYMYISILYMI